MSEIETETIGKILLVDGSWLNITPITWNDKKLRKAWIKLINERVKQLTDSRKCN